MLFNSFEFFLFLPLVFAVYWACKRSLWLQNLLIVVASYVFYGWWDWRFLVLIAFTSLWSYVVGIVELHRWDSRPSKALVFSSLVVNLGILGAFKYFNFFAAQFAEASALLGFHPDLPLVKIILPVGISFWFFKEFSGMICRC